ncbi:hypothetical protein J7E50_19725 [Pedobacter sp. ISL-68]|uniref:hypothetical protein n=1 Tax=unclassified Pedobacter TaxID=2628915 RepID=UPI001BEA318B|nr:MULTISPECIES: hypothetical protein [unclassified Pedobacter]MBT2564418.1 hypothetical protein [Pedobacter sp. ISL-64]MBT2592456.1 hypothetical protein [Pedobacter sp. ISL-68]
MKTTIDSLSSQELELYNYTGSLKGTIDQMEEQLQGHGIYDQYRNIHNSYFDLFFNTDNQETKLEILKRLVFLNWYGIIEPSYFTGIQELDNSIILESFTILNEYLLSNKIDEEFKWMLSYYSSWDFSILPFSENNLSALTKFVEEVDTTVLACPKKQLPKGTMDNRGQMGIYWKVCLVEKDE